jgi:hypothetical protein
MSWSRHIHLFYEDSVEMVLYLLGRKAIQVPLEALQFILSKDRSLLIKAACDRR